MNIMSVSRFPAKSARDFLVNSVGKLVESPYPDFITRKYYFRFNKGRVEMYSLYDIETGCEDAALREINDRAYGYMQEVEGFEVEAIIPLMSMQEALDIMEV
ncbi:MAG: hypothetical protein ACYC99_06680 [Candidatus Geothermincolia bacterium]